MKSLTLRIIDGPFTGQQRFIRVGQALRIGRTGWADFAIDELAMSAVHFEIRCELAECRVFDLNSTNGTRLNGRRIPHRCVAHGDVIGAGLTRFEVLLN